MKNNESIFGHLVFAYKVIIVLILFKCSGWCDTIPNNFLTTSFKVIMVSEIIALIHDGLTRGILFLTDEYEAHKRWRKIIEHVDDSKVRLHWNPETKEIIQIKNEKNKQ